MNPKLIAAASVVGAVLLVIFSIAKGLGYRPPGLNNSVADAQAHQAATSRNRTNFPAPPHRVPTPPSTNPSAQDATDKFLADMEKRRQENEERSRKFDEDIQRMKEDLDRRLGSLEPGIGGSRRGSSFRSQSGLVNNESSESAGDSASSMLKGNGVSVVDPLPTNLVSDWTPKPSDFAPFNEDSSLEVVFAGPGNPLVALHGFGSRGIWGVYDVSKRRMIGRARSDTIARPEYCALRRDGKFFATAAEESVVLTDVENEKLLAPMPTSKDRVELIQFLGTDRLVAIRGSNVYVWQVPSGQVIKTYQTQDRNKLQFSPGGKYFVVHEDEQLVFYNTETGGEVTAIQHGFKSDFWLDYSFSLDGRLLAAKNHEHEIRIWSLENGDGLSAFQVTQDMQSTGLDRSIQWFPGEQHLLLGHHTIIERDTGNVVFGYATHGEVDGWSGPVCPASADFVIARNHDPRRRGFGLQSLKSDSVQASQDKMVAGATQFDLKLPKLTVAKTSGVRTLEPELETPEWSVRPDPVPALQAELKYEINIPNRREELKDLRFSNGAMPKAALYYNLSPSSRDKNQAESRLEFFNLTTGRRMGNVELDFNCRLATFAPDGKRVATLADNNSRIDIWDLKGQHICAMRPFEKRESINAVRFTADGNLITLSGKHELVLWSLPDCKAIYRIADADSNALGASGRYLAVRRDNVLALINADNGEPVGRLALDRRIYSAAFHPSGRYLGAITHTSGLFESSSSSMVCWDMQDGKLIAEIPLQATSSTMQWVGESHVLVGQTLLVDVRNRVPVWTYSAPKLDSAGRVLQCLDAPDDRHWFIAAPPSRRRGDLKLYGMRLPGDGEGPELFPDPKALLAVSPGGRVALRSSLPASVRSSPRGPDIMPLMRRLLEENNIRIDNSYSVALEVLVEEREVGQAQYKFSGTRRTTSVNEKVLLCAVRFTQDGSVLWESTRVIESPGSLMMRSDESLEKKLTKERAERAANYFLSIALPSYVYRFNRGFGYGHSSLTYNGPRRTSEDAIRPKQGFRGRYYSSSRF